MRNLPPVRRRRTITGTAAHSPKAFLQPARALLYRAALLSEQHACPACGLSFPELTPAMFSFNSPVGMCPDCNGLGTKVEFDAARFFEPHKSPHEGGVVAWGELGKKRQSGTYQVAKQIVRAIQRNQARALIGKGMRLLDLGKRLLPVAFDRILARHLEQ